MTAKCDNDADMSNSYPHQAVTTSTLPRTAWVTVELANFGAFFKNFFEGNHGVNTAVL